MSWDNYGSYWEIDHVKPCSAFNLADTKEQQQCFHWSNLQPLEKRCNNSKSDNIDDELLLLHEIKLHNYLSQ